MPKTKEIDGDDVLDAITALKGAIRVLEEMAADLDLDLDDLEEED